MVLVGIADNVDFSGPYKTKEDHIFPHYLLLSRVKTADSMADFDPHASRVHVGARSATVPYKTSHAQREGSWSVLLLLFPWYAVLRSLLSYAVPCHARQRPEVITCSSSTAMFSLLCRVHAVFMLGMLIEMFMDAVALDGGREQGIPPPPVAGNPVEVPSPGFLPPPPPPGSPVNTPCPSTTNHATPLRPAYGNPVTPSPSVPIPLPPNLVGGNQLVTPIPSVPSPRLPPVQVPVSTPCYSIPIHAPPVPEMSALTPHRKTLQHVVKNIR